MMVNNEIGTVTDVAAIGELTRANKTFLHVDAAKLLVKLKLIFQP
jgi:cysteine desulfurase